MSIIKTIIFDFGDVFINLDRLALEKQFLQLDIPYPMSSSINDMAANYEKGLLTSQEFINNLTQIFSERCEKKLINAWNTIIGNFPKHRLNFIENLFIENQYKLILLSNTNDLHIKKVIDNMGANRFNRFKSCFHKFYLSHEIHLSKPSADIYEFVLNDNNIIPKECLFIDDLKENTDAAAKLGLHTWNLIPGKEDVTNLFIYNKNLF